MNEYIFETIKEEVKIELKGAIKDALVWFFVLELAKRRDLLSEEQVVELTTEVHKLIRDQGSFSKVRDLFKDPNFVNKKL